MRALGMIRTGIRCKANVLCQGTTPGSLPVVIPSEKGVEILEKEGSGTGRMSRDMEEPLGIAEQDSGAGRRDV